MHQCEYCSWFYRENCECPYVMRDSACNKAREMKENQLGISKQARQLYSKTLDTTLVSGD